MLKGKSLLEFTKEVERRESVKKDYLADTRMMKFIGTPELLKVDVESAGSFGITETAHQDVSEKTKIPKAYYDRMRVEAPELWAENANHWIHSQPQRRMVRVLDGNMRAMLSDSYRPIDNYDVFSASANALQVSPQVEFQGLELTERKMYIQAVFPKIEGEVKKGDVVQAGIVISNSEIGQGAVKIEPMIYRLVCMNGMITSQAMRKYHIGSQFSGGADVQGLFSESTKSLSDRVFLRQITDVVRGACSNELFEGNVAKLKVAAGVMIAVTPQKTIEITKKRLSLTDDEGDQLLENLIKGEDLSLYGLANAITSLAHTSNNYDRSVDFEREGGSALSWKADLSA